MPSVICFGDSNTYGYDPRTGGRYANGGWVSILRKKTDWCFFNLGVNGRSIPCGEYAVDAALHELRIPFNPAESPSLWILLGDNDLLDGSSAERAAWKMECFLDAVQQLFIKDKIFLIEPVNLRPGTWVPSAALAEESKKLSVIYQNLSSRLRIHFIQTSGWNIPLTSDGVHFTENGHQIFAEKLFETQFSFKE